MLVVVGGVDVLPNLLCKVLDRERRQTILKTANTETDLYETQ